MFNIVKKIRSSIFIKLVMIIIAANIIAIITVVELFEIYIDKQLISFNHNVTRYADYLVNEIGTPPDTLKARKISNELSVKIFYEDKTFKWSSHTDILSSQEYNLFYKKGEEGLHIEKISHGIWMSLHTTSTGRYLFVFHVEEINYYKKVLGFLLVVILTLISTFSYFLIRRVLRPINWLAKGVEEISKENLSYQVRRGGSDELGALAKSFNSMTKRIREMIKSKEQLLLDVSHELRSPLTRVKVALESIPQDKTKESISEDLDEIEKMITNILETERLNSSHGKLYLKETNISEILREVVQGFQDKHPGVINLASEDIQLKIDVDRVKIVLKNVIENALKYSSSESRPVEVSMTNEEKFVVIQIKDHGDGIPQEEIPYIFEPFYRIDKSRSKETGGYGLGLSLCKKIMEAHGGMIVINSTPGDGTMVILKFPK